MRAFLDKQVEEKKKRNDFDKYLDYSQANIWNTDKEVVKEQNRIINGKVIIVFIFLLVESNE